MYHFSPTCRHALSLPLCQARCRRDKAELPHGAFLLPWESEKAIHCQEGQADPSPAKPPQSVTQGCWAAAFLNRLRQPPSGSISSASSLDADVKCHLLREASWISPVRASPLSLGPLSTHSCISGSLALMGSRIPPQTASPRGVSPLLQGRPARSSLEPRVTATQHLTSNRFGAPSSFYR